MRMEPLEWAMLIALSLLWGGSFFFGEIAVAALPPLTVALCRVGIAALALLVLVRALGDRMPRTWARWRQFFAMGALNNLVPFTLILWGQTQISGGLASIFNATTPLFAVVLAHLLTADERLTGRRIAGVASGLIGVAVMIGVDALAGVGDNVAAQIAILCAAASYACASIYGRRFANDPPMITATGQLCASSVLLIPLAIAIDRPWQLIMPNMSVWAAIAGLALLSTALAYILFFRILKAAGATNLMLVTFLIPPSAILLGMLFLDESLGAHHVAGMVLVGIGLACIDGRALDRLGRLARAKPS